MLGAHFELDLYLVEVLGRLSADFTLLWSGAQYQQYKVQSCNGNSDTSLAKIYNYGLLCFHESAC